MSNNCLDMDSSLLTTYGIYLDSGTCIKVQGYWKGMDENNLLRIDKKEGGYICFDANKASAIETFILD